MERRNIARGKVKKENEEILISDSTGDTCRDRKILIPTRSEERL